MDETHFVPLSPLDSETRDQIIKKANQMTELDWFLAKYKAKHDPRIRKYLDRIHAREKDFKRTRRVEWWWSKGIQIVNLILALIAAVTGVIALLR